MAREHDLPMRGIAAVEAANTEQKVRVAKKIVRRSGDDLKGLRFGLWGLTFKPETDDMREHPSLSAIADLKRHGARMCAYDPVPMPHARSLLAGNAAVQFATDMYLTAGGEDGMRSCHAERTTERPVGEA